MSNSLQLRESRALEPKRLPPMVVSQPAAHDRLDLRTLMATLRRRRGILFGTLGVFLLFAIVSTAMQTPLYRANAQIALNTRQDHIAPTKDVEADTRPAPDIAETEAEVMRSRELAATVVDALDLTHNRELNPLLTPEPGRLHQLLERVGLAEPETPPQIPADQLRRATIDMLLGGLDVQRIGITYAFTLSMTATNPRAAQIIVNEYARQYTQIYLRQKRSSDSQAMSLLSTRLEQLRAQAQADTARVQQYRIANNLPSTTGAPLTEQEISSYNAQVVSAKAAAAEDQARLQTARAQLRGGSQGDDVGEALGSSVVGGLRARQAEISGRLANLQSQYGERYPEVQRARSELRDVTAQIDAEIRRVISNLEAKARVSSERLASLQGSLGSARGNLSATNRAMVGLDDLQRRAEASQQTYDSYLARYKETAAQEGTERPEARVLSFAELPYRPTSPRPLFNLAIAGILGLGLGVAAALVSEMLFTGVTTASDVESRFGLACLGGIPLAKSVLSKSVEPRDAVVQEPQSGFAEAFRSVRTSLRHGDGLPIQVLAITSALPREGKTTLSTCLARVAALDGERAVLVDVDVRRRSVSQMVGDEEDQPGLIQYLRGEATLEQVLIQDTASGLFILPIRRFTGDAGNLLIGEQMDKLIDTLRERFALVVLDTPPVLPIADTRALAAKADAVIMTVRWRSTADHAVTTALHMLPHHAVTLAGVVLSMIDIRKQARFGYGDGAFYYKKYQDYYA